MNTKVILIVALVVAGAILFATTRRDGSTDKPFQRQFASKDEISLTAKAIISELDAEAMEALPSDLTPNTDSLTLTDEEETELFAILNSVAASGVLGALGSLGSPGALGTSQSLKIIQDEKDKLIAEYNHLKAHIAHLNTVLKRRLSAAQINKVKLHMETGGKRMEKIRELVRDLDKKWVAETRRIEAEKVETPVTVTLAALEAKKKKFQSDHAAAAGQVKHQEAILKRRLSPQQKISVLSKIAGAKGRMANITIQFNENNVMIRAETRRIDAEKKAVTTRVTHVETPVKATLAALEAKKKKFQSDHAAAAGQVKHQEAILKRRLSPQQKISVLSKIAGAKGRMASITIQFNENNLVIAAETRRLVAEKKALVAKELVEKRARVAEAAAAELLKERERKAAEERARIKIQAERREKEVLEAKRLAEKARQEALAKKTHDAKVAAANKARMAYEKARAKKEADEVARKGAELLKQKRLLEEKQRREKVASEAQRKRDIDRRAAEDAARKAAEAKKRAGAQLAEKKAREIQDRKRREQVQQRLREEALDQQKKEDMAEKKRAKLVVEEEQRRRAQEKRNAAELKRKLEVVRREQQVVDEQKAVAKAKDKERTTKAALVAADQKRRKDARNKQEQEAVALKQKQLALEKKAAVESARAKAVMEKTEADVAAKKALVRQKGLEMMKAEEEARIRKKSEELAAIEAARATAEVKRLAEAAEQLNREERRLAAEVVRVERAVRAEKERLAAEQKKELEAIEREHEHEKRERHQMMVSELQASEQEIKEDLEDQLKNADKETATELIRAAEAKFEVEKALAQQKLESRVSKIEEEKQDLVEKKEEVQELEREQLDLEGDIERERLLSEKRVVEEDQEIVEEKSNDVVFEVADEPVHPRASKKDRVSVSRKKKANGSIFIKISVPSDLSPGEFDEVSIFLSRDAAGVLEEYQKIYKRIGKAGSLANVSVEEKQVLASAGAEFKVLREQYVDQRKFKVLARSEGLVAQM